MADGCYNPIDSVLVENEQDTLGIIAYSLYKRQKIEFIQAFKVKHDREPKDEDLAPFHDVSNSPTQVSRCFFSWLLTRVFAWSGNN
ncbi:MAG: hypothetical protein ACN6OP_28735 [Pseudomonadales bacterium]